jgi:hypothetical protein
MGSGVIHTVFLLGGPRRLSFHMESVQIKEESRDKVLESTDLF